MNEVEATVSWPGSWIKAADHMGLHVSDLERSLRFYRDVMGLKLVLRRNPTAPYTSTLVGYAQPNIHSALLRVPGTDDFVELLEFRGVQLEPIEASSASPGTAHLAFNVSNVDEAYAYAVAQGVRSISAPVTASVGPNKGRKLVYLLDPDGIRVELIESAQYSRMT